MRFRLKSHYSGPATYRTVTDANGEILPNRQTNFLANEASSIDLRRRVLHRQSPNSELDKEHSKNLDFAPSKLFVVLLKLA